MNPLAYFALFTFRSTGLRYGTLCAAMLLSAATAFASPGAHGPNGEHLDGPAQASGTASAVPRIEANSDAFELVGRLQGGELSILISRYDTNEPVLNAKVEVESGALKASAKFHADMGDYAVDNAAMLKALAAPGDHAVVISIVADDASDLLDGTLSVPDASAGDHGHAHDDSHAHGVSPLLWAVLGLVFVAVLGWLVERSRKAAVSPFAGGTK